MEFMYVTQFYYVWTPTLLISVGVYICQLEAARSADTYRMSRDGISAVTIYVAVTVTLLKIGHANQTVNDGVAHSNI